MSHFFNRTNWWTRFEPANIDLLCGRCHTRYENDKNGWYLEEKIIQLGKPGFKILWQLANKTGPLTPDYIEDLKTRLS